MKRRKRVPRYLNLSNGRTEGWREEGRDKSSPSRWREPIHGFVMSPDDRMTHHVDRSLAVWFRPDGSLRLGGGYLPTRQTGTIADRDIVLDRQRAEDLVKLIRAAHKWQDERGVEVDR